MNRIAPFINPLLAVFGLKIIRTYLGRWYVKPGGGLARHKIPVGWRLARRGEWDDLPEDATELDRLLARRRRC